MIATGPGWSMRLGDCIAGLRELADDSVDVTITDPPYDDHTHRSGRRGDHNQARYPNRGYRIGREKQFSKQRDLGFAAITAEQMNAAAEQFARVTRRWVNVFCAIEMVGDSAADDGHGWRAALERAGLEYVRTCVWHKLGSTPQFTGDRPAQAVEAIVVAHRPGRKRWNGGGKHGYYAHPIVLERGHGEVRLHTTQKPLSLVRELVRDFSEPGELVLDAYAGSATTGVACVQEGRQFVGWELASCAQCSSTALWRCSWCDDKDRQHSAYLCELHRTEVSGQPGFSAYRDNYFDIACRRLRGDEAKPNPAQPSLFGGMP